MISTEAALPAAHELGSRNRHAVLVGDLAGRDARLISRLLLALVLASASVLIPGEANRFLEARLCWSELA